MNSQPRLSTLTVLFVLLAGHAAAPAQVGSGWVEYKPPRKVHLAQSAAAGADEKKTLVTFEWKPRVEVGEPEPCASYRYDEAADAETFTLLDGRSNRSEIRLHHDYGEGSRQFEGYVTFDAPLDDQSLFQVWGSDEGATQLMMRGYAANGGEIGVSQRIIKGVPRVMAGCYGKEIKVNVIHLQEDVGNKFIIYLNDKKVLEFADDEKPKNNNGKNYHKYGCYGTLKADRAAVKWRKVRHYKDGVAPTDGDGDAGGDGGGGGGGGGGDRGGGDRGGATPRSTPRTSAAARTPPAPANAGRAPAGGPRQQADVPADVDGRPRNAD